MNPAWAQRLERLVQGWRAPLLAALFALLAVLPGLIFMPVLDRDEARFAQASAQMIESGDYTSIDFQDLPRMKKPVGIYWMQAAAVKLVSHVEARRIWAFRLPSLLGAMLAAGACCWGASAFYGGRRGFIAGAVLGACLILSTEGFIAKTDAMLCGLVTLAMAALARVYARSLDETVGAAWPTKAVFWLALAMSILVKGPIGPMIVAATLIALWIWDRRLGWAAKLGWGWGAAAIMLVVGPWAAAITVTTDGGFWTGSVGGDMLAKLTPEGRESHGVFPGAHTLLAPVLLFPSTLMIPLAAVYAWACRARPGVRFALCWLVPSWLIFELIPTKLPHYTMPLYGALAWLICGAVTSSPGRIASWVGGALGLAVSVAIGGGAIYAARLYGGPPAVWAAVAGGILAAAAGVVGGLWMVRRKPLHGLFAAILFGVLAHDVLAAAAAPQLKSLWVARRMTRALNATHLDPRNGITPGPVAVAGIAEPSVVFLLGTETELTDASGAADAIAEGRPAFVDRAVTKAFMTGVAAYGVTAQPVGEIRGLNYSKGKPVDLILYRSLVNTPGDQP